MNTALLGEIVDIRGGGTPSRSVPKYWGGDIPWATVKDFKSTIISKTKEHITQAGVESSATNIVPAGNIIIPTRMALGKVAINSTDIAINQDLKALLIRDNSTVDRDYLCAYLASRAKFIESRGKGATVKGITLDVLNGLEVPLPPINEQQRIAAILEKADDIRRKRQQAINLADELLRSVFLHMCGDPILNRMQWTTRPVQGFCRLVRGSSPRPKGDPRFYGGPIPRLMVEDITRDGWFVTPKVDSLTDEGAARSRPVPSGTVVMVVSGKVGAMSTLAVDACIHDGLVGFLDLDEEVVLPDYLMFVMTFLQQTHAQREAGAIFKNITTTQIKEMNIPLPTIGIQDQFSKIFKQQRQLLSKLQTNLEDDLFHSLSQRAFTGEL